MQSRTQDRETVSEGVRNVAEGLLDEEAAITESLARAVCECMPDLGSEAEDQIVASARANIRALAQLLSYPEREARGHAPPPETIAYMHMLVYRGLDIDVMARGYRVAHANLWRHCARVASTRIEDLDLRPLVLERASDLLYSYTNACVDAVAEQFQAARRAHVRWPIARRMEAVVGVLDGKEVEEAELSTLLNYEIAGAHLGLVVSTRAGDTAEDEDASASATAAALRIGKLLQPNGALLTLPAGCDTAWLWIAAGPTLPDCPAEQIVAAAQAAGATVGIGEPGADLAGFRETHLQAREAADCARALRRTIARYEEIALTSALFGDQARAMRLMHHALGELVADDPKAERLRETVRTFLDSGLSIRATARQLGTHHHTVNYRLRQAEELLGREVVTHAAVIGAGLLIHDLIQAGAPEGPLESRTSS